jgi:hypothetical protein
MSEVTTTTNTNNQLTNNYDYSKIFLFGNQYENGSIENATGAAVTIPAGTLMGRIGATQLLTPLASAAVDGSQFPVGVLAQTVIIPATTTLEISIGISGDVAEEKIIFDGTDDLDTLVSARSLRDRIASDTMGIKLVASTELTGFDN